jgi:hypothetical protein
VPWDARFHQPVELLNGNSLRTLADARTYILKLPKSRRTEKPAQVAAEALIAAANGVGTVVGAQDAMSQLVHEKPESSPSAKEEQRKVAFQPSRWSVDMKQSDIFRQNANNCLQLAERAQSDPACLRFRRMARAWRALADEQDWLDGEISPVFISEYKNLKERSSV